MRMTLVLLLVLGGLLGAMYFGKTDEPTKTVEELTEAALGGRALLDAQRIELRNTVDGPTLEFTRDRAGDWMLEEPIRDRASLGRLSAIAGAYNSARLLEAYPVEDVDQRVLSECGLLEPRARLFAAFADGLEVELLLGETGAYGHDLFVMRGGAVFRASLALHSAIQAVPEEFREQLVFRNTVDQLSRLTIERPTDGGGTEKIELVRRGQGAWRMTSPADLRIDQAQAQGIAANLTSLRVGRFLAGAPAPTIGPAQPARYVIELEGVQGKERVTLDEDLEGRLYTGLIESRGVWFDFPANDHRAALEVPLVGLRAYWLVSIPFDEVTTILVDRGRGTRPVELERTSGRPFRLKQPIDIATDATVVNELAQGIRSLVIRSFVKDDVDDLAPYGLDEENRTVIQLSSRGRFNKTELHLGSDADGETAYLRRADEPHVVTIPKVVAERFRRDWSNYITKRALRVNQPGRVRKVAWEVGDAKGVLTRQDLFDWRRADDSEAEGFHEVFELICDELVAESSGAIDAENPPAVRGRYTLQDQLGATVVAFALVDLPDGRIGLTRAEHPDVVWMLKRRDGKDLVRAW